ncbi:MAG: alpha/beta fold hydrolase [Balneolaceae bacterium]|nr:alpha/beta fold hydrolase [Balneolaceae bacterium]
MNNSKLSKPDTELKSEYDVVVIGSGYGGSIAASRMARAGRSVCLLEKGEEIRPGDYPAKEIEAASNIHVDAPGIELGKENNLYQFLVNDDISVFQGCGLGGTSLVNANVSLPPEPWVMQDEAWPEEIRNNPESVYRGIERAKHVLQPVAYPAGQNGYEELPKTKAQMRSAEVTGGTFKYTPINVQFKDGLNAVGYEQKKCTNCGDCVTGCNVGAKNTTLMNYLPDAVNFGAEIFTGMEVAHLSRTENDKWQIHYRVLDSGSDKFGDESQFITADFVFLGAGSLGSTAILLNSRAKGLTTSDHLGERFTGNGDVLAFAYNADQEISGVGLGHIPEGKYRSPGPCITSVIDRRKESPKEEGMVIEEGVIPGPLSAAMPKAFKIFSRLLGKDTDSGDSLAEKWREVISLFRGAYRGALNNTQTYLVMSHDDGKGKIHLEDGRPRISWPDAGKQGIFKKVNSTLEKAAKAIGGTFIKNPAWTKATDFDLVTVHPLGGAPMGHSAAEGVVNHKGQVFKGTSGTDAYTNLIVCDGAIIPRPLGVNPLLTISGLAERICEEIAADNQWTIDYGYKPFVQEPQTTRPGLQFTESMTGFIQQINGTEISYQDAFEEGRQQDNECTFVLTISTDDVQSFLEDEKHEARMQGTVDCRLFSGEALTVNNGYFNLFRKDERSVNTLNMDYRMQMQSVEGDTYYFEGFKKIKNDPGFDVWSDTTTLFIDIYRGGNNQGKKIARGVLHIKVADFIKQMQTIKIPNADSKKEEVKWTVRFSDFFTDNLTEAYGGVLNSINLFNPDAPDRDRRPLNAPLPEVYPFKAKDGIDLRLTRYKGGNKGPVMLVHGLGVSSLIFSIDTIKKNLVEYLCEHNYDVWLIDNRVSIEMPDAGTRFSGDDIADNDYEPAIEFIRQETNSDSVHVLAHCFGSTTFTMALLKGLQHVKSLIISQIGPHIKAHPGNLFKSKLYLPELLDVVGFENLTAYTDVHDSWKAKVFNSLLKFYPYDREDRTINPVSNRITFLYGQLYELDQLNQPTFDALHELFGVANIEAFTHLAEMIREEKVVSESGQDMYLPNLQQGMAMPVTFIHGEENTCYRPLSTKTTYEKLKQLNPGVPYTYHLIPKYGHIDCIFGKNAHEDVYPYILQHLENHA